DLTVTGVQTCALPISSVTLPEECTEEGWWHHGPEDEPALYSRARRAADHLLTEHQKAGHRILLVTHGGFGSALLDVLLGLSPCEIGRASCRERVYVWV